jgi:sigma-54 dependent transcriptional regulator, acetoin dehydrogenase operon transcriptional activator AcoR
MRICVRYTYHITASEDDVVSKGSGLERARQAREAFLAGGPPAESLPPAIRRSWLRSADLRVRHDVSDVPQITQAELDDRLLASVAPVLESFAEQLADTGVGLLLADSSARILRRWSGDFRVRRFFDRVQTVRGSQLSEPNVGTNGVGTALEAGTLVHVRGPEHVIDLYQRAVCTGAPIHDPITGRTLGAVTLSCQMAPHSGLLVPLLESAMGDVEAELLNRASPRARLLLDAFLRLTGQVPDPVVALAEGTTITTTAASRLLTAADLVRLGEVAERAARDGRSEQPVTLSGGRSAVARCEPVGDGLPFGHVVALTVAPAAASWASTAAPGRPQGLPGLVGSSAAWRAVVADAEQYRWSGVPLLVTGEPGVGKTAVAAAVHARAAAAGLVEVLDAALEPVDGTGAWLGALRQAASRPAAVTVVRHLDALSPVAAQAVCGILDTLGRGACLIGTVRIPLPVGTGVHDPLLERFGVATLTVPPLRERLPDVPALLAALVTRHAGDARALAFTADAAAALGRYDWPGNVRQMENLVRRLVAARTPSPVGLAALPAEIGEASTRRRLSPLEQLELQAIRSALRSAQGNRAKAAASLGISRATLYRRLRLHGLADA